MLHYVMYLHVVWYIWPLFSLLSAVYQKGILLSHKTGALDIVFVVEKFDILFHFELICIGLDCSTFSYGKFSVLG